MPVQLDVKITSSKNVERQTELLKDRVLSLVPDAKINFEVAKSNDVLKIFVKDNCIFDKKALNAPEITEQNVMNLVLMIVKASQ